jgi:hypothetical protein
MKECGMKKQVREMAWVFLSGLMALYTRGTGKITKQMGKEDLFMQMEIFTLGIGKMIKHMDKDSTFMQTVPPMRVSGLKTSSKGRAKKHGQMELSLKDNMPMA